MCILRSLLPLLRLRLPLSRWPSSRHDTMSSNKPSISSSNKPSTSTSCPSLPLPPPPDAKTQETHSVRSSPPHPRPPRRTQVRTRPRSSRIDSNEHLLCIATASCVLPMSHMTGIRRTDARKYLHGMTHPKVLAGSDYSGNLPSSLRVKDIFV